MIRRWIAIILILALLTEGVTGCSSMDLVRGVIREYEDNKEGIKSELYELKEAAKSEIEEWINSVRAEE